MTKFAKTTASRLALAAAIAGTPLSAQTASGTGETQATQTASVDTDAGEIIVTARKREEKLQDVPLSISAFTAATIEKQGLNSVNDIANVTPGLSYRQAFGRTFDRPVIRGQSNIQGNANVGFFIDGIFVTGSLSSYNLQDVERVEVIKGPQSALFGRNTFAGAINYITRKPDNETRGRVAVTVGEDGLREYTGYASFPIVEDKLWVGFDGRKYEFDGQYTNVLDPVEKLGREKSKSGSVTLRFKPLDTLDVVVRYGLAKDEDGAFAIARVNRVQGQTLPVASTLVNNGSITCFAPSLRAGVFGPAPALRPVADNRSRGYKCGEIDTPRVFGVNSNVYRAAGFPNSLDRTIQRTSIKAEQELGEFTLTGIAAWNERRLFTAVDQDYSDLRALGFETFSREGSKDSTYEIRLQSPADKPVRGLIGVYKFRDLDLFSNYSGSLTNGTTGAVFNVGDNPAVIIPGGVSRGGSRNKSVFGLLEVDVTEQFKVTAEGRYQQDEVTSVGTSSTTIAGVAFSRPLNLQVKYKKFLPRVTANYKVTPDVMVYGNAAKGNKPGGFNTGVFNAVYPDAEVARLQGLGLDVFKEESDWVYEAGVKSTLFDRRVTANLAAYYIDWKNQQLTQTIQAQRRDGVLGSVSFTSNVGKSRVQGLELDIVGRVNDNLSIRFGYALADSKIKSFIADDQLDLYLTSADIATLNSTAPLPAFTAAPSLTGTGLTSYAPCQGATPAAGCTPAIITYANGYLAQLTAATPARFAAVNALLASKGNAAGNSLPRSPKHQVQIGADFSMPVGNDVDIFFRPQLAYESKRYVQVDNLGWAGDSYNLNLRAGFDYKSLTITAFMTNALNDRTPSDILRSIDNGQTYFRPALRPGEATANIGGVNVSSTNPRDFAVTAPRLRNFGVTASYKF